MEKFKKIDTELVGVTLIKPTLFGDNRGFFLESYNKEEFKSIGLDFTFVQDNHSKSKRGVLRGLHFQTKHPQGKLIRVIKGAIYDIVVDIRKSSPTYGNWYGVVLSEENRDMLLMEPGFAHGFLTLEDDTEILYKCTDIYAPSYEDGISYDDKDLNIDWKFEEFGIEDIILSEKDKHHKSFKEYTSSYQGENILILGANGQLGQDFQKLFDSKNISYIATNHNTLDITNSSQVRKTIEDGNFDIVINCAAYNEVDKAESDIDNCYLINSEAVKNIKEVCESKGIIFVTYSTDFVFSGDKLTPYSECNETCPLSTYGKSKLLGEDYALTYHKSLVIRTSWVFGMGNNNFCKQVINWSKDRNELNIVDDLVSAPTYTVDLAKFTYLLLEKSLFGLYHFSNNGEASKYDQAKYILDRIGWQGELKRAKSSDFRSCATRPNYSKLSSKKIEFALGKAIPHWKDAIDRFLVEMKKGGLI